MLTLNDGRDELWQWDTGRTLSVDADCSQVHFSNKVFGRSIDVDVSDGVAVIPDILLQTDKELNVLAFVGTAENGYTKISKTFKVNRRNKPADYVFTPVEQTTIAEIAAIAQSVRDDADAGLFDGAQGPAGPIGPKGEQGIPGPSGHTPEYGVDYGTPEQITFIANKAADVLVDDIKKISDGKVDKVDGKGLSTNDYDNAAKTKVDAIPDDPKYTDTVYDDTEVKRGINQLKDDLADKLPKSPANWEPWTAEEQAAAREMIKAGSAWGMDLPLLKTITLEEAVSSIDILSSEEGITLQEFSVFLFATAAGDDGVDFYGMLCLRSNGGAQYWGYSDGYIKKTVNACKIWHTKIYDNKFAVTDIIAGWSGTSSDIAYDMYQGLFDATKTQYSAVTSINRAYPINNLNLLLIGASTSGAVIPRGSMIFLFGR